MYKDYVYLFSHHFTIPIIHNSQNDDPLCTKSFSHNKIEFLAYARHDPPDSQRQMFDTLPSYLWRSLIRTQPVNHIIKRQYYKKSWRKLALLDRLPYPKPQEKVRLNEGSIVHSDVPLDTKVRGKEHIFPLDFDYMHVVAKDQDIGLVLAGLHPKTRIKDVRNFLRNKVPIWHCWIREYTVIFTSCY
jgi:hypothetical protein